MNLLKSLFNYYQQGFSLTNKSWDIYLINLLVTSPTLLKLDGILSLINLVALITTVGFSLSIPLFLQQKQQGKSINLKEILFTTLKNTKRLLLPFLLFIVLCILMLFLYGGLVFLYGGLRDVTFLAFIIIFGSSFLIFSPILFSIEQKGLIRSAKQSFLLSIHHIYFVLTVMTVTLFEFWLFSFLPQTGFWPKLLHFILFPYMAFVISSATLIYYQRKIRS